MNTLTNYLVQIGESPRLSFEREQELAEIISTGQTKLRDAVNELVVAHLKLVVSIALKYRYLNIPLPDLISDGNFGLIKAAERIKPSNTRFSTYAVFWIRQSILAQAPVRNKSITVPSHVQTLLKKIARAEAEITNNTGREATPEEVAKSTGLKLKKLLALKDCQKPLVDMDGEHNETFSQHELISADTISPDLETNQKETVELIIESLARLTPNEQIVINGRFGINCEKETLKTLGTKLELSRERIRQIEVAALKKLKGLSQQVSR